MGQQLTVRALRVTVLLTAILVGTIVAAESDGLNIYNHVWAHNSIPKEFETVAPLSVVWGRSIKDVVIVGSPPNKYLRPFVKGIRGNFGRDADSFAPFKAFWAEEHGDRRAVVGVFEVIGKVIDRIAPANLNLHIFRRRIAVVAPLRLQDKTTNNFDRSPTVANSWRVGHEFVEKNESALGRDQRIASDVGRPLSGDCRFFGNSDGVPHDGSLFAGGFSQTGGFLKQAGSRSVEPPSEKSQESVEKDQKPIGGVFRENLVPLIFLLSFIITLVGADVSDLFAYWAIPAFGFGWLAVVVYFGLLQFG
jgi:hypothetical protein